MVAEDFEITELDFICVVRKLLFMVIVVLATGIIMKMLGGIIVSLIAMLCVIVATAGIEIIEEWSDDYGKNNKKI